MSIRLQIAAMLFLMIQAMAFFAGTIALLLSPLSPEAMRLLPWVIGGTAIVSALLSWWLAPRLRARTWKQEGPLDFLK
ncbi:hypothetical protein V5F59_19120 [Xanthobacter autotrophicus DSM 431]|uniref:hypothetical protein n=1 Tax=Xanthobacter nonsaccharivorans TaxID=3119912 RepID=UPI00372BE6CF